MPLPFLPNKGLLLDVGSGGGFPCVPIKIARPELIVHLVDSSRKKVNFQKQVILELGLTDIFPHRFRIVLMPGDWGKITVSLLQMPYYWGSGATNDKTLQLKKVNEFDFLFELDSDGELRQATAITEYVEALPSKHKQTLGEIEKKTAESHGFFDVIARRLERNLIAKLIEDTYNLLVQFSNVMKGLEGKYLFKVGGLTLLLQQEKLKENLGIALEGALGSEELHSMTDIPMLWKKTLTQMSLQDAYIEPQEQEEIPPEEKARQDIQQLNPQERIALAQRVGVA